jgi:putative spermidine/putrescine transport system substrate-binding protein
VATWSNIPSDAKASDGTWFADYGGYVAIGYNAEAIVAQQWSSVIG